MLQGAKTGTLDRRVQFEATGFKLVCGEAGGDMRIAYPAHNNPREWFGDKEAIPGVDNPCALRLQMKCADGGAGALRELDGAHLGLVDGAARAVGSEDRRCAAFEYALEPHQAFAARAGTGAADRTKAKEPQSAGDELAVETAADED